MDFYHSILWGCLMISLCRLESFQNNGVSQIPEFCHNEVSTGSCEGKNLRWYYDGTNGQCLPFIYTGCRGNLNNFVSKTYCEDTCRSVCNAPRYLSPCMENYTRWFYDSGNNECKRINYGGCGGSNNVFKTSEMCDEKCISRPSDYLIENKCDLPLDSGVTDNVPPSKQWYYDKVKDDCYQFAFKGVDGNRNRFKGRIDCIRACKSRSKVSRCEDNVDYGKCGASMLRWYFSKSTQRCFPFFYSGCGGNFNNFNTRSDCNEECLPHLPKLQADTDYCLSPPEIGDCRGDITRWFYDPVSNSCQKFTWGGCLDDSNQPANNFEHENQCLRTCSGALKDTEASEGGRTTTTPSPSLTSISIDIGPECLLPRDSGPCRASFRRFYYDSKTDDCMLFVYGGCMGNGNNYGTFSECRRSCKVAFLATTSNRKEKFQTKTPTEFGSVCWDDENGLNKSLQDIYHNVNGVKKCRWDLTYLADSEIPNLMTANQLISSLQSNLSFWDESFMVEGSGGSGLKREKRSYPNKYNQPPIVKPLQDYIMQMNILSIGNEVIYINDSYTNNSSPEYQELARLTSLGVEIVCRTSDLRLHYLRNKVSDAYDGGILNPILNKRILLFTLILLSADYDRGPDFIKRIFKGTIFTSSCFLGGTRLCVDPVSLIVFPASLFDPNLLTTMSSITTPPFYVDMGDFTGPTSPGFGPNSSYSVSFNVTANVSVLGGTEPINNASLVTVSPETNSSGANETFLVRCDPGARMSGLAPPICGDNSMCTTDPGMANFTTVNNDTATTTNMTGNVSWCVCNPGFVRWGDSIHCKNASSNMICQPFEYMCQGVEPSCLAWKKFQDGTNDCPDGSDESCLPWQFDCKVATTNTTRCVSTQKINDGVRDCQDGSDENR